MKIMMVAALALDAVCWSVEAGVSVPVELKETKGVEAWVNCAEPGAWRLDVCREGGGQPGVEVVRVTGRAERALKRPKLEVGFRRTDGGNVRTLWRTDLGNRKFSREGVLPWSWSNFETSFGYQMPLYAFLDSNDMNVLTLASSDSRNRVGFRGGMEEGPNVMLAKFDFNDGEPEAPTNAFEVCVRCDSRALPGDRVIPAAAEWMRKADPSTDYPVPDAAFEPLWSSWCAYHWDETDAIVEREAEEAKKLGLTTVLIDWGWQNPPGKGKYFGEGLPAKRYTDDFAAHVKRLHDKGMAVTMWFPMTLFTDDCPVFESFRPHALCRRGWGPYVWDPRFAVRRDYFLSCVERAVRDWKVDGLKIDFGDSWGIGYPDSKDKLPKLGDDLGGRDIRDLSEAAALVVGEARRRLTAMRPDLTIEFRQTYIGPGMCKGCTQVRVQDCPGSQREMRYGIANLRLTCGPNAVHSDPIQWNRAEPDEQVADSILASIFGIGQYSVRLTDETPSHKRLLARWVRFAKEHCSALYRADFRVQGLTYDAPVLVGEDAAERIVGAYVPGFAADCGLPDKRVILLNGTGRDKVLVRFGAAATGMVLDLFGEKVGVCQISAGLSEVAIPRGGCLEVERLSGGAFVEAVMVRVDSTDVKARVPRTLYGTGMEDVNHEIYGGLDAQRLYDESFEETLPPQRHNRKENDGHRTCGRQWENVLSGGGTARQDDAVRHLGARSQALAPNGGSAGVANRGLNGWGVPCCAGRRMRGWLFARGRVDSLEVALQRDDGRVTYATNAVPFAGSDDWTRIDFSLTPDRTDPRGRFLVRAAGTGEVWIDDVYLADEPTNEFGRLGCREDIVEGLRREGLTFLRWGGTMVNTPGYSLVNAVGDRRPYRGFWFINSSTGFHIREFVRLSAALGLPCAFSVHTYEDTAAAAELARWTRQFDIDMCVEIGNEEVTGWGDDPGAKTDIPTCRKYAESVRRISAAMRRENPRLRFASATMFQPKHMEVMEESFRLTDGVVDCWDLHLSATDDPRKSYASAKEALGTCRDMFRRLNPKTTMKVAVFEENGWEHGQRRALSHAAVLAAVREFGDFVLTSCPANALQACGQNDSGWDQGQVFYTTDSIWLQPCGWAQQMASAFHRGLLVASSCDDEGLIVSATKDEEGRSVVLHVVNTRGVGKKLALAIAGAKWRISKAVSLSSPDPQADNPPDDPERISPKDVTEAIRSSMTVEPYSYTVIKCRLTSDGSADDQG